jgi:dipeptidyl aminopeptidase/acylaminoacyl peptidase
MRTFISAILLCCFHTLSAQYIPGRSDKPPIDTADILHWPVIPDGPNTVISNNGEYLLYRVWHIPRGGASTMLRSVQRDWETMLPEARQTTFTDDSRHLIYITPHNGLCILTLPDVRREYESNAHSFELFTYAGKEMLVYQRDNPERELVLQELIPGVNHVYDHIDTYIASKNGQHLLLKKLPDSSGHIALIWIDLQTKEQNTIWKGSNAASLCFDESGQQLAFLVHDSAVDDNVVWLYRAGRKNATELFKAGSTALTDTMKIVSIDNFSRDGRKLFLQIAEKSPRRAESIQSPMTIWSYSDQKLQTVQEDVKRGGPPSYLAVLDMQSPHYIWRIQQQNENISVNDGNNLVILTSRGGNPEERYWNKSASCNTFLATVNKKNRIPLPLTNTAFSPNQKYLLGNGMTETWGSDLYIYEIATKTVRNITASIAITPQKEESDMIETSHGKGLTFAGWLSVDMGLLVYDYYDIWRLDPTGKRKAIRLTNGREQKIRFRLAEDELNFFGKVIQPKQPVLLTAFNTSTKQNGFYRIKWGTKTPPELLFMGDYYFSKLGVNNYSLKAREHSTYLVRREQADQSPNIFSTSDFRSFSPVTHMHPERSVNWYTSELLSFTTSDGTNTQAILYKPQNFDPAKKYPLLIHYYDKMSDELNRYRPPQGWGTGADLDVAWFASHGYLVLLTDIHYSIGKTGESVYQAVVGAAKHLSERPYIDRGRIGIQGHSFGGYETSYVITHSNLFAAAVSSAGVSEATSSYGSLWPDGSSVQEYFEQRGFRIDIPPWKAPATYANNSPIFSLAHTNTPVLIVHNKSDGNVLFEQSLGFFTGLRRTGKHAWMLQYDNGGHGQSGEDYKDYIIRTSQFFNHYLKGSPPPRWMTHGIPAATKRVDDGLVADKEK